jgi:hypothetical protein
MVSLEDREGVITKEILKSILQVDLKEFWWKEFFEPKFNAGYYQTEKAGTIDIIDETRNLDAISDFDKSWGL